VSLDELGKGRISLILNGRGERIRTSDPLVPNQMSAIVEIN
jgi:hypothetical protein